MERFAVGVDLGGSHLAVGLVDTVGKIHDLKEERIDNLAPPEATLAIVAESIKKICAARKNVCAAAIGLPGNLDSSKGICRFSPNFPAWHHVEVTPYLAKAVKLPVYMLNDVRVATLGELHYGAGKNLKNLVMMAIGTGIGGGVVAHGELLIGAQEAAGEIGHMTIDPRGPLCNCGNHGCMEAIASGPAIAARGAEAILRGQPTRLREKVKSLEELSAQTVAQAALEGDPVALRIFREAGHAIGVGIANLAVTLNPDRFIIGGGVAQAGEPLFSAIEAEVKRRLYILPPETVSIVPAELGIRAGLVGAAAYGFLQSGVKIEPT